MNTLIEIAKDYEDKSVQHSKLSWVQYTTGIDCGVHKAYDDVMSVLTDSNRFKTIQSYNVTSLSEEDQRRHELLYKTFKPYHLSEEINALEAQINQKTVELSQLLNTHRASFEGRKVSSVELNQILSKDPNRERRRAAYMAKNQINQPMLDAGFLDLVDMRKQLAQLHGKDNFVALKLEEDELSQDLFDTWKEEVKSLQPIMKETRSAFAQKYLHDTVIYPWDEAYIAAQIAPSLNTKTDMTQYYAVLSDFFKLFGFDITQMNITYDVFSRANKSEWGYNFPIQTGVDSRILANVKDQYNEYGVLLHETGHAIHSFLTDPEDILLNLGISGIISEGIANLFGGFMTDELFYQNFFDKESVSESFIAIRNWFKMNAFRSVHRILLDQAFYKTDLKNGQDIESLYWALYKDLYDEDPFCENPPWAFLIHHTTHPIYLHNYFMGDVTCEMLKAAFSEKTGHKKPADDPAAFGHFVKTSIISPAGRYPYEVLFERICGKKFSLAYLKP